MIETGVPTIIIQDPVALFCSSEVYLSYDERERLAMYRHIVDEISNALRYATANYRVADHLNAKLPYPKDEILNMLVFVGYREEQMKYFRKAIKRRRPK